MEVNPQNFKKYLEIVTEIDDCLSNIYKDTRIFSFPKYLEHPDYHKLLNMGDRILPYLFHYALTENGFSWFIMSLFSELSGENPVPEEHAGLFSQQISDWLNWFATSKYIESDVYHGLID